MAAIIGATASVITLASLFKGRIDAFDLFKCAKNQDADLKRLNLKPNIERCRLLIWGQSVGLANDSRVAQNLLSGCAFQTVIEDSPRLTIQLLTDSEDLARKYGCRVVAYSEQQTNLLDWESETPSNRLNAPLTGSRVAYRTQRAVRRAPRNRLFTIARSSRSSSTKPET